MDHGWIAAKFVVGLVVENIPEVAAFDFPVAGTGDISLVNVGGRDLLV